MVRSSIRMIDGGRHRGSRFESDLKSSVERVSMDPTMYVLIDAIMFLDVFVEEI